MGFAGQSSPLPPPSASSVKDGIGPIRIPFRDAPSPAGVNAGGEGPAQEPLQTMGLSHLRPFRRRLSRLRAHHLRVLTGTRTRYPRTGN